MVQSGLTASYKRYYLLCKNLLCTQTKNCVCASETIVCDASPNTHRYCLAQSSFSNFIAEFPFDTCLSNTRVTQIVAVCLEEKQNLVQLLITTLYQQKTSLYYENQQGDK